MNNSALGRADTLLILSNMGNPNKLMTLAK